VVRWRWTPFFALVTSSLFYVLIVILIVPSKIDARSASAKGEELVIVGDEPATSNALTTTRPPRPSTPRSFATPPSRPATPPASEPTPAPMPLRPDPPVREPEPPPPPPPPPEPPPPAQEDEEEAEEEEEQGAVQPRRIPPRALAGALRILPPPAGRAPAPEPEPEPDEPDEEEE
jgi:hypothetical protein